MRHVVAGLAAGMVLTLAVTAEAAWDPANPAAEEAYSHPAGLDLVLSGDSITCNMVRAANWSSTAYGRGVQWTVNCRIGRYASEAVDALWRQQSFGSYGPRDVVLAAGSNDCHPDSGVSQVEFRAAVDKTMQQGGPARRYLLVDIHRTDPLGVLCPSYNSAIVGARNWWRAQGYNVSVGYWSELCAANPAWLAADGIHPSSAGLNARAGMILDWATGTANPHVR